MVTLTLPPEAFEFLRQVFGPQSPLQVTVGNAGVVVQIQQAINDALAQGNGAGRRPE